MWNVICLAIFLFSFLLAYYLVFPIRRLAFSLKVLDYPATRKVHTATTPLLGGLAIFLAFVIAICLGIFLTRVPYFSELLWTHLPGIRSVGKKLSAVLAGGALVVSFGLVDDIIGLKPWQKLSLQILSGLIVFSVGIRISLFMPGPGYSLVATVLWLVLMMNSFNLLDNMDGLSSGVAFVSGGILLISALNMGQLFVATILAAFLGSTAGFLRHNFPPARIFMGECGSSFLGYFLGTVVVLLTFYRYEESRNFLPVFTPLVVFSVPFFDTLSVIWIRRRKGLPVFKADKNHFSHRLVNLGMSQKQAILVIYLLTLCTGMGALLLNSLSLLGGILVLVQTTIIISLAAILEASGQKRNSTA